MRPISSQRKSCLVLGANGFIGSHIVDRLAAEGALTVRAFDRFSRAPQFHLAPTVTVLKGDVRSDKTLDKALAGTDYVIHCLSATSPFTAEDNPVADIKNLLRSVEIFDHCVRAGVKKIVFISSGGAVYGKMAEKKQVNEQDAPMPVSPYGICKLSIEHYLEYFKRKHQIDYVVYRLTNPYGPRQIFKQNQGVIPAFLHRILQDQEITVFGDGSHSRDYIYIEDAVDMITRTFQLPNKHPIYNIGSGTQTTLNEILTLLKHIFDKEITVTRRPAPTTFLKKTDVSIQRFCAEFGEPTLTPFYDGLSKTIANARVQS